MKKYLRTTDGRIIDTHVDSESTADSLVSELTTYYRVVHVSWPDIFHEHDDKDIIIAHVKETIPNESDENGMVVSVYQYHYVDKIVGYLDSESDNLIDLVKIGDLVESKSEDMSGYKTINNEDELKIFKSKCNKKEFTSSSVLTMQNGQFKEVMHRQTYSDFGKIRNFWELN